MGRRRPGDLQLRGKNAHPASRTSSGGGSEPMPSSLRHQARKTLRLLSRQWLCRSYAKLTKLPGSRQ